MRPDIQSVQDHFRPPPKMPIPAPKNPLDETISLDCEMSVFPDTVPQGGLWAIEIQYEHMVGVGVKIRTSQPPGSILKWEPVGHLAEKCTYTNYGQAPAPNVIGVLTIKIVESIKTNNGSISGRTFLQGTIETPRAHLGTGDQNSFTFYIYSETKELSEGFAAQLCRGAVCRSEKYSIARLIAPRVTGFFLDPKSPYKPRISFRKKVEGPR